MSEYDRHCPDCGGSNGFHYNDCIYDGTDGPSSCSFCSKGSSNRTSGTFLVFYIIALIIGYSINELLGAILLIGIIFWFVVCRL